MTAASIPRRSCPAAAYRIADTVDIEDHTYIGVVQAHFVGGDAGGQVFMFEMNGFF